MLRQDPSSISSDRDGLNHNGSTPARPAGVDIQRELNRLEEMILDSPRLPMIGTLVKEEQLLDQLDLVRLSLPEAFQQAEDIVHHKEDILFQAEQYAQEIIEVAERRAAQILDEMGILRQAELEAQQIRQRVQQECELAQEQTLAEIDRLRRQVKQEIEEMHRDALTECEEIQRGADRYADGVLRDMENQFNEMIRVIRNGRQQLQLGQADVASARSREATPSNNASGRAISSQKSSERSKG